MSKKLLLADDSITIQKVIGITFANEDYELTVVDNGDAGLETARKINPDLILADVFMPGKNGYELCAAVKQDPALSSIPVLLLTGTFEPFDENKARAAGAESWIAKPFESQALIDRVEELLRRPRIATAPVQSAPIAAPVPLPSVQPPVQIQSGAAAQVQVAPTPAPAAPVISGAPPIADDDLWGDTSFDSGVEETPAVPADGRQAGGGEDDLWGGIALEEDVVAGSVAVKVVSPAEAFATPIDDAWGDLAEEIPPVAAPAIESTAYAGQPVAVPVGSDAVAGAGSGWDEFDDDILSLDDVDIVEEEDLLEVPGDSFAEAGADAPEMTAEPEMFDPFAEDEILAAEPARNAVPQTPAADWNDIAAPAASVDTTWDLTDDDEAVAPVLTPLAAPAQTPGWDSAPDDAPIVAVQSVATAPAPSSVPPASAIEAQVAALTEEDLARIVEKVAGAVVERLAHPILERLVWEVVPDLAEAMIREEIRLIKDNIR